MNEYSILMNLLSGPNPLNPEYLGATEDQICEALGLTGKNGRAALFKLLEQFSRSIMPFGLLLRQNPLNHYWYLTQSAEIENFNHTNPLLNSIRLGATLCTILLYCISTGKPISIEELQNLREKKSIQTDLDELVQKRLIIIENQFIHLHPNLGYYFDFEQFLEYIEKEIHQEPKGTAPMTDVSSPSTCLEK